MERQNTAAKRYSGPRLVSETRVDRREARLATSAGARRNDGDENAVGYIRFEIGVGVGSDPFTYRLWMSPDEAEAISAELLDAARRARAAALDLDTRAAISKSHNSKGARQ